MKVSRFWSARRRALGILACLSVLGLALVACWQTDLVGKQIVKLKDSNPWVRIKAVRALRSIGLGSIKDPRAVEALIAAHDSPDEDHPRLLAAADQAMDECRQAINALAALADTAGQTDD